MATNAHNAAAVSSRRNLIPWLAFAFGLLLVAVTFSIGIVLLTDVQARRSSGPFLGFSASGPMLWAAFVCCTISPLFTKFRLWVRCLLAVGGALAFGISFLVGFALLWILRPPIV